MSYVRVAPGRKFDWDAAWHLFVVGATHEEITKQLDIPNHLLDQYSFKHEWKKRRIAAREVARQAAQRDLTKRIEQNRAKHQHFVMDQLEESEEHISQLIVKKQDDSPFAIGMPIGQKLSILKQHDDIARRTYKLDEIEEHDPVRQGFALLVALQPNKNPLSLVNDSIEEIESETVVSSSQNQETNGNVVELGPDFVPVKPLKEETSGIQVLPAQTEAFAGILSPLNGHINPMEEVGNVIQRVGKQESGEKEQKEFEERTPREWQTYQAVQARREQKGKEEPAATVEQVSNGIKPLPKSLY